MSKSIVFIRGKRKWKETGPCLKLCQSTRQIFIMLNNENKTTNEQFKTM